MMYYGAANGLYRSADGITWDCMTDTFAHPLVYDIEIGLDGAIYFGTDLGYAYASKDQGATWDCIFDLPSSVLCIFAASDSMIYIGTVCLGLARYDPSEDSLEFIINTSGINYFSEDKNHNIYFCTDNVLHRTADYFQTFDAQYIENGSIPSLSGAHINGLSTTEAGEILLSTSIGLYSIPSINHPFNRIENNIEGYNFGKVNSINDSIWVTHASINAIYPDYDLFYSSNKGLTWLPIDTSGTYSCVAVCNDSNIFLCDYHGLIKKTSDFGQSWSVNQNVIATGPVQYVCHDNSDNLFAAYGELGISKSSDHGISWQLFSNGIGSSSVLHMCGSPRGDVFISTYTNELFRLLNNDSIWQLLTLFPTQILDLRVNAEGYIYAHPNSYVGIDPVWIVSTDVGITWDTLPKPIGLSLIYIDKEDNLYGTTDHAVYRSEDGGQNWQFLDLIVENANESKVVFVDFQNNIYQLSRDPVYGGLYRSKDSGYSWDYIGFSCARGSNTFDITVLPVYDGKLIVLAGYGLNVNSYNLYLNNGLDTIWNTINSGILITRFGANQITYDSLGYVYINSNKGVYKTSSALFEFERIEPEIIISDSLLCYPNPANTSIFLVYNPKTPYTYYRIFNSNGQFESEGKIESMSTEIAISSFCSGIYFIAVYDVDYVYFSKFMKL